MHDNRPAVTFRPLQESDLPLLHAWLDRPHVSAWWWDAAQDFEQTRRDFLPLVGEATSTRGYIALLGGEPIGFAQSYVAFGCGDGWWEQETDPGVRGIDQFLCNEHQLGRGLGSRMVAAFVRKLFEDPAVTRVQTDPAPHNARAIRCYLKCGFREIGVVTTPDGPALLLVIERARA